MYVKLALSQALEVIPLFVVSSIGFKKWDKLRIDVFPDLKDIQRMLVKMKGATYYDL